MDLKIRKIAEKGEWLARLSLLLRDAQVLEAGSWDVRERRFEMELERIFYEYDGGRSGGSGVREYPSIAARLIVAPVTSFGNDVEAEGGEFGDGDEFLSFELDGSEVLRLATRRGVYRLTLSPEAWLEIFDVAEASHRRTTRDHGGPMMDMAEMQRLLTARVI